MTGGRRVRRPCSRRCLSFSLFFFSINFNRLLIFEFFYKFFLKFSITVVISGFFTWCLDVLCRRAWFRRPHVEPRRLRTGYGGDYARGQVLIRASPRLCGAALGRRRSVWGPLREQRAPVANNNAADDDDDPPANVVGPQLSKPRSRRHRRRSA